MTQEGRSRDGALGNCCPTFLAVKSIFPFPRSGLLYNKHICDGHVFFFVVFFFKRSKLTSIITQEGPFRRGRDGAPYTDGSWVIFIHSPRLLTETPVSTDGRKAEGFYVKMKNCEKHQENSVHRSGRFTFPKHLWHLVNTLIQSDIYLSYTTLQLRD